MNEPAPITYQINELRERAGKLAEKAKHAQTKDARETLLDLANLYREMAESVARLEALRHTMREDKRERPTMNRAMLDDHLAQAERHIAQGQLHVKRQRELVAQLAADGHADEAARASGLLKQFEDMQALHVADRDRLRDELAAPSRFE